MSKPKPQPKPKGDSKPSMDDLPHDPMHEPGGPHDPDRDKY